MKLHKRHLLLALFVLLMLCVYWVTSNCTVLRMISHTSSALHAGTSVPPVENRLLPCTPQDYAQRLNDLMAEATLPYRLPAQPLVIEGDLHDSMTLQFGNDSTLIVLVDKASQQVASITLIINGNLSGDTDASALLTTAAVAAAAVPDTSLSALTTVVAKLVDSYQRGATHAEQTLGELQLRYDRVPFQAGIWFWIEPSPPKI